MQYHFNTNIFESAIWLCEHLAHLGIARGRL